MRSVRSIKGIVNFFLSAMIVAFSLSANAQENSPLSRYGLGDLVPYNNMATRGMGGIVAGYADYQCINYSNPASFAYLSNTILDLGGEVDVRTLKSNTSPDKYRATNLLISYLQMGVPLSTKKMLKKGHAWGLSFGLHPLTRVNYKILKNERISNIDSLATIYEGTGGLSQITLGMGFRLKNLRFGFNTGFNFGYKDYSTRLNFINDTLIYYKSNYEVNTRFTGLSLNAGLIYDAKLGNGNLKLGAYANLFKDLKASQKSINETFYYDGNGGTVPIDTVSLNENRAGSIKLPSTYSVGFSWSGKHLLIGADVEKANWSQYRYYGQAEDVQDIWRIRAGIQYYPASDNTTTDKYFRFVKYRLGFYYGPDYIKLNGNRPEYAITAGAGFPLTSFQLLRRGEFVVLNTGVEIGSRGNKDISSIRESIVRFNFGVSMNARWFQRAKYD